MIFKTHSNLVGTHAFLSASDYHWINYDEDKLVQVFHNKMEARLGIKKHAFAKDAIELGIRLPDTKQTLNRYVNDAIGYRMTPEQVLRATPNCYGTADAASFDEPEMFLRIHDLKNGLIEASMTQLKIYNAFFCMDYGIEPNEIRSELRIYQNDRIVACVPESDEIFRIMDKIKVYDKIIEELKRGL